MTSVLKLTFTHIALPPKLPGQSNGSEMVAVHNTLVQRFLDAITTVQGEAGGLFAGWSALEKNIKQSWMIHSSGFVNKTALVKALNELEPGEARMVYLEAQNTCVLIRKPTEDSADHGGVSRTEEDEVIIEAFETSPAAGPTLATKGALQWDFPGTAVKLDRVTFEDANFQQCLAGFLEQASLESVDEFCAKTHKAGVAVVESRDTTNPALVTQFLMTFLEAQGSRLEVPVLRKRVRDDVCWYDAELPWRRSPFWLSLRVFVQRFLLLESGTLHGRLLYKSLKCILLGRLLSDCLHVLELEDSHFLKVKLCRCLAKLNAERQHVLVPGSAVASVISVRVQKLCEETVERANSFFHSTWDAFKLSTQRKIPTIPFNATEKDMKFSLPNSSQYLLNMLDDQPSSAGNPINAVKDAELGEDGDNDRGAYEDFVAKYSSLAEVELAILHETPRAKGSMQATCKTLASRIVDYMSMAEGAYRDNPEQISLSILVIFQLWIQLDQCATEAYPLLEEYHPLFEPALLEVLLISRLIHFETLQSVQTHLRDRCARAKRKNMTIFTDPVAGCFADRYINLEEASQMRLLQQRIDGDCTMARASKEKELHEINEKSALLLRQATEEPCTERKLPDGTHDIRGCKHCYLVRCRNRLKIAVHEDYLPPAEKTAEKRAIVFEMSLPEDFDAYRQVTWDIAMALTQHVARIQGRPELLLRDYAQLRAYTRPKDPTTLTLASSTKSFLGTHYKSRRLPAMEEKVILPFGLKLAYYDPKRGMWVKSLDGSLSFAHSFALELSPTDAFSDLRACPDFSADRHGPTSYQVMASSLDRPSQISKQEFIAYQNLAGGVRRRWLALLTELGSSNLNFSLKDTTALIKRLALQAGPSCEGDVLRNAHTIFRDVQFCLRLAEQVRGHVTVVALNWREASYMETILIMTRQLYEIGCVESSNVAKDLVLEIRRITLAWVRNLRDDMRAATEADVAERTARYCFLSALFHRQTFFCGLELDKRSLQGLLEVTAAMQEAMVVDVSKLTSHTRNLLVHDTKGMAAAGAQLRTFATQNLDQVALAIDAAWPEEGNKRVYLDWQFLPSPRHCWFSAKISGTELTHAHDVRFHILEGHLLVDGKSIGKLPAKIRDSELLHELFGNQKLVAFPSHMHGMSYMLAIRREGHTVHVGNRDGRLIVRALKQGRVMELVPRQVFGSGRQMDLPNWWVEGCVHWIRLDTATLEVRRHPRIWRECSWTLDIRSRKAQCPRAFLIDPYSQLSQLVARVFQDFEEPQMITVMQPLHGSLIVELKRMDLTFHVNRKGLLQCRQLFAEIDPNQNAGTLYGLRSMLVLRDVFNRSQRSIITTMGISNHQRHGVHVAVSMGNDGSFARYTIDDLLGRLVSPPEPRLLYHKALIHALTSFVVPDPLTGRTGTEEALACLRMGLCQPWTPLSAGPLDILRQIGRLTPGRRYYPPALRLQQTVSWDPCLTSTIQHDSYLALAVSLIAKSDQLSLFNSQAATLYEPEERVEDHLRDRSRSHRARFERTDSLDALSSPAEDTIYAARDCWCDSNRTANVYEVANLMQKRPSKLRTIRKLIRLMERWPMIGGYHALPSCSLEETLSGDISREWGGLVKLCLDHRGRDDTKIVFQLSLRAFRKTAEMNVLKAILSFAMWDDLERLAFPVSSSFIEFRDGEKPTADFILSRVSNLYPSYQELRQTKVIGGRNGKKTFEKKQSMTETSYQLVCAEESYRFAEHIIRQWPSPVPSATGFDHKYLNAQDAIDSLSEEWHRMYNNSQLSEYVRAVQRVLDAHMIDEEILPARPSMVASKKASGGQTGKESRLIYSPPRLDQLLRKAGARPELHYDFKTVHSMIFNEEVLSQSFSNRVLDGKAEIEELKKIALRFSTAPGAVESAYGQDLEESILALEGLSQQSAKVTKGFELDFGNTVGWLNDEIQKARQIVDHHFRQVEAVLSGGEGGHQWLKSGNLWPVVTPVTLLEALRSDGRVVFGAGMKEMLIDFGKEVVNLQQLTRMKQALGKGDTEKFYQEVENLGPADWDACQDPDWLLLEIDANMRIRPQQVTVAEEMIHPKSGSNSALQMNMGQGKTSLIIPMIACALADGEMMVRVIVPRALLAQTAQVLQARLGGLLRKEVVHVPFTRRTPTSTFHMRTYREIHENIRRQSGIILEIPENILSFRLSGIQRLSDLKVEEATEMIQLQQWKDQTCRDVLDECDATLAVNTQLVYPGGSQLPLDGQPQRWEVIMAVLNLVAQELPLLARDYPNGIEVVTGSDSRFPVAHFLNPDVETALARNLVDRICSGGGNILPSHRYSEDTRRVLRAVISSRLIDECTADLFKEIVTEGDRSQKNFWVLRGLFGHGILVMGLKKRWNVQYGIHPQRFPVAVPFHAKGVPSDQAEWGHPDVSILLTCLAFYHQGLNADQFSQSLRMVLRSDDPAIEYDQWASSAGSLVDPPVQWSIINLDDQGQIHHLWLHLRFSTVVINHYLRHFVFPTHAQQFSFKLQASGWDVPLFQNGLTGTKPASGKGPGLTTGFSGTNDNRRLLPLTIQQHDLDTLLHTNAEVLSYLLQKRSREYFQAVDTSGARLSEVGLLRHLKHKKIHILLDAGAFILEMDNQAVVRAWLQEDSQALAAVYFGKDNKPWVQYRDGKTIPLLATPFAENMKDCLVYVDEAHTRGTDLRLPAAARGALTLGLGQTKDKTVQAAMRLRNLGSTQSVTFVAPSEVHHSILHACHKSSDSVIDSGDVVSWLIHQTCIMIKGSTPLYCWQGRDFCSRHKASASFHRFLTDPQHRTQYLKCLQQPEHQSLEQLYCLPPSEKEVPGWPDDDELNTVGALDTILRKLRNIHESQPGALLPHHLATEEVEQELELAKEVEQERELQKSGTAEALTFPGLHQSVRQFVETGSLAASGNCVEGSALMRLTSLWRKHDPSQRTTVSRVFMSPEFVRTVRLVPGNDSDNFLRPVNWVLFSRVSEVALIIIPEEAELIIPIIQSRVDSPTHILLYAAPVTKRMLRFDQFDFYSLPTLPFDWTPPSWLSVELGLLAGRLYFKFAEYDDVKNLVFDTLKPNEIVKMNAKAVFLQDWLSLRHPGQDISHTPMGYICQNLSLRSDHLFFTAAASYVPGRASGESVHDPLYSVNPVPHADDGGESSDEAFVCFDSSAVQEESAERSEED